MLCLQRINWAILLRRDCHGSELPANVEFTIPRLNDLFENENEVYFQQDGAPPHFHVNVRNFVDRIFNERWIGRRESATDFPPRSPYLTPLDFYLWGTLKNTAHSTKPQTLEELRDQIEHAINDIPLATIQTVCRSVRRPRWETTVAESGHFEHVTDLWKFENQNTTEIVFLSHFVAEK